VLNPRKQVVAASPTIFVSVFAYAFGKTHYPNVDAAKDVELAKGEDSTLPAFRSLARLRRHYDVALAFNCSTLIAKARCVMAGTFLHYPSPLWVSIDDDVDASEGAMRLLVEGAMQKQAVILAAMRTRTNDKYNVGILGVDPAQGGDVAVTTGKLFPILHGGAALTAIPYECLKRIVANEGGSAFDEDGLACPALFQETIIDRAWIAEDDVFCRRARAAGVELYSFISPGIVHAGIPSVQP